MVHKKSIQILKSLRKNNVFVAAGGSTHYTQQAWIRDNIYEAIGYEKINTKHAIKTYHILFDLLKKHEYKLDYAIKEKPKHKHQYIHARFNPLTLEEFHEDWGNKQNDAVGAFLFKVGQLEKKGIKILRNKEDEKILQKLVFYLRSIEYWHDKDNGMWEENEEIHASSVGACVAGLQAVKNIVKVPQWLIDIGKTTLELILPRESKTKVCDLALLSLVYPYNVVSKSTALEILKNVEKYLVRTHGVIRYKEDYYYNDGSEAEWCMGFPWLAICYKQLNNQRMYNYYMQKTKEIMTEDEEIPELYYGKSKKPNENTPLGWAQALYLVALGL